MLFWGSVSLKRSVFSFFFFSFFRSPPFFEGFKSRGRFEHTFAVVVWVVFAFVVRLLKTTIFVGVLGLRRFWGGGGPPNCRYLVLTRSSRRLGTRIRRRRRRRRRRRK